jgi:hypothetical protein
MAILANVYFKLDKLKEIVRTLEATNEKGVSIALSINDDINGYNQNISAYVSQTKEQRDSKQNKNYVGNGSVIWTDGTITVVPKKDSKPTQQPTQSSVPPVAESDLESLPF